MREAVATELIAHGEFSSTGNSYPNALLAADEVIKIVLAYTTNAKLSCGAESNRHSGAVGAEKRAEQGNPGGGHVTEPQLPEPYERKAAGMIPRPAADSRDAAQGQNDRGEVAIEKCLEIVDKHLNGHVGPQYRAACENIGREIAEMRSALPSTQNAGPMVPWELNCKRSVCAAPECDCPAMTSTPGGTAACPVCGNSPPTALCAVTSTDGKSP